jgi:hypothetical protein
MKSIFDAATRTVIESRVGTIRADSRRQWGTMTPHQAVCHLSDAFKVALGDRPMTSPPRPAQALMRIIALHVPLRWPHGVKTLAEVEQGVGGTAPAEFDADRRELRALIDRFCGRQDWSSAPSHPIFGALSRSEWGIWGYRHLDHHLRQFGC